MSVESAFAFMEVVRTQPELKAILEGTDDFEALLEVAIQKGFQPFSKAHFAESAWVIGGEWLRWATAFSDDEANDVLH